VTVTSTDDFDTPTGTHNRIETDGTHDYLFDDQGNEVRKTHKTSDAVEVYDYDVRNRLVKVTFYASTADADAQADATKTVEYTYDLHDRRIGKTVDTDGDGTVDARQRYVWDVAAMDGKGNVVLDFVDDDLDGTAEGSELDKRYLWGQAVDQLFAQEDVDDILTEGEVQWALTDNLGTVRDVVEYDDATDTTSVAEHFTYEAFGAVTSGDASVIRHTYTAQEFDADTGLFYYDKRWYRPETGRFLTPDPIEDDPTNDYRYVDNSPTNVTDPHGLEEESRWQNYLNAEKNGLNSAMGRMSDWIWSWTDPFLKPEPGATIKRMQVDEAKRPKTAPIDFVPTGADVGMDMRNEWQKKQDAETHRLHVEFYADSAEGQRLLQREAEIAEQRYRNGGAVRVLYGAVEAGEGVVLFVPTYGASSYLIIDGSSRAAAGVDQMTNHELLHAFNEANGVEFRTLDFVGESFADTSTMLTGDRVYGDFAREAVPLIIGVRGSLAGPRSLPKTRSIYSRVNGATSTDEVASMMQRLDNAPNRGPAFKTWNQFQSGTKGQFATRAEAAKAWDAYKQANGIVTGSTRSRSAVRNYLKGLADDPNTPSSMKPWLEKGRVPPGYEVDHIKPLSIGGADDASNMRLQLRICPETDSVFAVGLKSFMIAFA